MWVPPFLSKGVVVIECDYSESGVIFYEDGLYISLLFGQTVWEGSDIDYNLEGII